MTASIPKNPEFYNSILDRTPFKRFEKIEEMAGSAVFLASSASDFVTGVALPVDGKVREFLNRINTKDLKRWVMS